MPAIKETERRQLYGRRRGHRLRPLRQSLLDEELARHAITLPPAGPLQPASLFDFAPREIWLEIGFGNGEHLAELAARHRDIGFLGCEPFLNGVSAALKHIVAASLGNVRLLADDARGLLDCLPERSLARVYLLFPDPWPKKRHHRRRFISPRNLDQLARVMAPGALLRLATDHHELGRWMLAHTIRHPAFEWLAEGPADWRQRPPEEPPTRYEGKALAQGGQCLYLSFRRR